LCHIQKNSFKRNKKNCDLFEFRNGRDTLLEYNKKKIKLYQYDESTYHDDENLLKMEDQILKTTNRLDNRVNKKNCLILHSVKTNMAG
jgi:hypothetical protein